MRNRFIAIVQSVLLATVLAGSGAAQTPRNNEPRNAEPAAANPTQLSQQEISALQDQLLTMLRVSPTLAEVVSRDPSLLADNEYVMRNNPQLAHFLQAHPEIAHNPDFYLFNNLHGQGERASDTLDRKLWPEMMPRQEEYSFARDLMNNALPFMVFLCILVALLWLTHVLLENRRWNRIFKLQTDVHNRLLERFGTSQEVLTYMSTESGKRFLEATPIATGIDRREPVPSPVARVLTPLQIGIVMSLLGIGLISLRHSISGGDNALLVLGVVVLMPGVGFIISAGITWVLARHLGLMPQSGAQS
jgi:hypothetical protein